MGVNNNTPLPYPPYSVPMTDDNGMVTQQWSMWLQQAYVRMGGQTPVDQTIPSVTLNNAYARTNYLSGSVVVPFYQPTLGLTAFVDSFQVLNTSPFTASFSLWNVPINQIPSDSNRIVNQQLIPPGVTFIVPGMAGQQIGTGAYVVEQASNFGALLCTMKGRIIT